MGTPKVNFSDAVQRAVKQIAGLQGKKGEIDTHYEYEQLGKLLTDVQAGKLDKNLIDNDSLYIKGLQIEYQNRYLGGKEPVGGEAKSEQEAAPKQPKTESENAKQKAPETVDPKPVKTPSAKPAETPKKPEEDKEPPKSAPKNQKTQPKEEPKTTNTNIQKNENSVKRDGIIVTGDNNQIIIDGAKKVGEIGAVEAEKAIDKAKDKQAEADNMLKESKENYTEAFAQGRQVAKDLIGYTTTEEKANAIRHIMKQSPATIMGFISGFNENDTVMGIKYGKGGLLDQIDNEYGWTESEKREVFTKIMSTTLSWAKSMGFENDPNYIRLESDLEKYNKYEKIDTEKADMFMKELVSRGKAKATI